MSELTPLNAKVQAKRYRERVGQVMIIVFLIVICVSFLSSDEKPSSPLWDAIGLAGIGICLFIIRGRLSDILTLRLRMFCPHCDKHIETKSRWRCGYCDNENDNFGNIFVYSCACCKREPKALICPHCNSPTFLDTDNDASHPAVILLPKEVMEQPLDTRELNRKEHLVKKEQLEQEIEIAALEKRLAQFRLSAEFKKELSAAEKIQKDFSELEATVMGVQLFERSERVKNAALLKHDPETLEMKNLTLDMFVEQRGLAPNRYSKQEKGTD